LPHDLEDRRIEFEVRGERKVNLDVARSAEIRTGSEGSSMMKDGTSLDAMEH